MIRFTKAKATPPKPKKPKGRKKAALNKLKAFLAQAEPETVEILVSNFNAQRNAVTYKELREAYLAGGITQKQFEKWQQDYAKLITSTLAPKWEMAAAAAAQEVKDRYPRFIYEPSVSAGMDFIRQHGAELVTNLAAEQRAAVNAVIAHVSGYTAVTPDEAARIIRPCVGLTKPQAVANARYREKVKNSVYEAHRKAHPHGNPDKAAQIAERKAQEAAARYAARQHRYRAQNIARTELAFAYNAGAYGATKDAQAQGYIGDCVKVWLTAYDERVCPICSAMDDEKRNIDETFSNGKLLPPAHPSCRCAVTYEEIPGTKDIVFGPPVLTDQDSDGTITIPNYWGFQTISEDHDIDVDVTATNPNYHTGREWQINCQRCVSAYEARRRGYNVTAKPALMNGTDTLPFMLNQRGWANVYVDGIQNLELLRGKSSSDILKSICAKMRAYGDGARAIIRVRWQSGGGHVFIAEQVGSVTRFVDPQSGKLDVKYYFNRGMIKPPETRLLRIDDKDFTDLIKECVN